LFVVDFRVLPSQGPSIFGKSLENPQKKSVKNPENNNSAFQSSAKFRVLLFLETAKKIGKK
jgi:hypothetical protein